MAIQVDTIEAEDADPEGAAAAADTGTSGAPVAATLRGDASGFSKWAQMSITANPDMGKGIRRLKNPEVQNYFRMPVSCTFDQDNDRLIVCDTHRGRLQVYNKDREYMDPQFNL